MTEQIMVADGTRHASPRSRSVESAAWRENLLILGAMLAVVLMAQFGPAPNLLRLAFPFTVLVGAAVLLLRDLVPAFMTLVLWTFATAPLVRRLIDLRAGWLDANPVMLAPYVAASLSVLVLPLLLSRRPLSGRHALTVVLLAISYGLLIAVANGQIISGGVAALRWAIPVMLAALLIASNVPVARLAASLEVYFILSLALCGAYGVWQFLVAPAWDGFWMVQSEMNSIGRPEPFEVRVFSTWNSPGSFSLFLLSGLLILIGSRSWLAQGAILVGLLALILTLVRSTWMGLVLGLLVLALKGGMGRKLLGLAALMAAVLPLVALDPQVEDLISERIQSLTQLGSDESAFDRLTAYRSLLDELEMHPFGQGLAVAGSYAEADGGRARVIDGGLIEVSLALGVIGGAIYLAAVAALVLQALPRARLLPSGPGLMALIVAYGLLFGSGTTTVGEVGLFFWIATALLLASSRQAIGARSSIPNVSA